MPIIFPVAIPAMVLPGVFLIDKVLLAVTGILIVGFAMYIGCARCPACGKLLGMAAIKLANERLTGPAQCPSCHVTFDDPMPGSQV